MEIYSSDYVKDGLDLLEFIKLLPESSKITHTENYPFYQFYGYNTVIYYRDNDIDVPILYLYSNNKKCIPYKQVPLISFDNIKIKYKKESGLTINIGSFDFNIFY